MSTTKLIGTFQLGWRWVDLFVQNDTREASFEVLPDAKNAPRPRITLGLDWPRIEEVFQNLAHESLEFVLADTGCRWRPDTQFCASASDTYRFTFDHNQFSEAVAMQAVFLWLAHPALEKAHAAAKKH